MRKILFFICLAIFAFGEGNFSVDEVDKNASEISARNLNRIIELNAKIKAIDENLKGNIWIIKYANFQNYQELTQNEIELEKKLKIAKTDEEKDNIKKQIKTISDQLALLSGYENMPFSSIITMPEVNEISRIHNPFAIITNFSNIKSLESSKSDQKDQLARLMGVIEKLKDKELALNEIAKIDPSEENQKNLYNIHYEIREFNSAYQIGATTYSVFEKKIDEQIQILKRDIKTQVKRALNIAILIFATILIAFLLKFIAKKYIKNDDNFYLANKFINVINFTLIVLILIFSYIENMTYLVTILGFASAGLAIAMKDMFMSMLGWSVIIFGGTFRVGDRVRVEKDRVIYVGDIIDISVLRMTIYEDITYLSWKEHHRAGRIIFIPNNYIFTELIANYTHNSMKTVWDGIDITITFDSNHKKAMYIIKNIARKYSKGYTDIAKKQMGKLRSQYSIKNPNVEPRIFSFFEPYGIQISVWYMTNSYATLGLRSNISSEILESFRCEPDIKIAYPKQTLFFNEKIQGPVDIEKMTKEQLF